MTTIGKEIRNESHLRSKLWFEVYHGTPGIPVTVDWKGDYFEVFGEGVRRVLKIPSPSEEEWNLFWKAVDKSGVWNWGNYPSDFMDGSMWHLKMELGEKTVDSYGHMSYPGQDRNKTSRSRKFNLFTSALEKLLGLKDIL